MLMELSNILNTQTAPARLSKGYNNMKQEKQIRSSYSRLIEDVKSKDFYTSIDLTNRVNCYSCSKCGHITKTKDVDAGVTPFMHSCESCGGDAKSSFYHDIFPAKAPTQEWYRPSLEEVLSLNKSGKASLLEHILMGGLCSRPIK